MSTNELAKDASTYYKVYPNPVSKFVYFQGLDARFNQIDLVQLMDLSGRIILEDHHPDGSLSLDKVPSGIYLLLIWHQRKGYFTRIVKQ